MLPEYLPGQAHVLYICGSTTNISDNVSQIQADIMDARWTNVVENLQRLCIVAGANDLTVITSLSVHTNIAVAAAATVVTTDRRSSRIDISEHVQTVGTAVNTGTLKASESGLNMNMQRSSGGLRETAMNARIDHTHEAISARLIATEGTGGIKRATRDTDFGALYESISVGILTDSDLIRLLVDANIIDGFYDADNILMKTTVEVPQEEINAFRELLNQNGPIADLLNRAFSESLRTNDTSIASNCLAELTVDVLGNAPFRHGNRLMFTISLVNRNQQPIYDAVIVNAIPKHTSFDVFPVLNTEKHGVLQTFMDSRNIIVWKLYRPLQPGETFRASYAVVLDRWKIL